MNYEMLQTLPFFGVITAMSVSYVFLCIKAQKVINSFDLQIEQLIIFKPVYVFNGDTYILDKMKRWNNCDAAKKFIELNVTDSTLLVEMNIDKTMYLAFYEKQISDEVN
jgi:hypothetical protein